MTYLGAIKQLHDLRNAEDMPLYYKPAIAEVINVLLMDAQEVRHGRWEWIGGYGYQYRCSECIRCAERRTKYCPHCGAYMVDEEG